MRTQFDIAMLDPWLEHRFSRSPGAGGQNVNKVNTRVTLLFDFEACTLLTGGQKTRLRGRLSTRLSRDGRIRVTSHRHRTQGRNRSAGGERLVELIAKALTMKKRRVPTAPSRSSRRRRLEDKRRRGEKKRDRQSPADR